MTRGFRTADGGRIDRSRQIRFTFDGKSYEGFPGDTLASALLANGVHLVARSFKYHRPRGVLTAGAEEPNALVQIGAGARAQPNTRATQVELYDGLEAFSQNNWPSLATDFGALSDACSRLLPAGFYYKTFMRPKRLWEWYESHIRRAAGMGRAPEKPDPDIYDKRHLHCDVLVCGGGPAGIAAALAAGRTGARVVLADEQNEFGGALLGGTETLDDAPAMDWVRQAVAELETLPETGLLTHSTAFGLYDHGFAAIVERVSDHLPEPAAHTPRQRLWKIRAKQIVLATGAHERPLVFADNDRPGIMLAGAARAYLNRYGVLVGKRVLLFTNNDSAYDYALDLVAAGGDIAAVVDLRPEPSAHPSARRIAELQVEVLRGWAVVATKGRRRLRSVKIAALNATGDAITGTPREIVCDAIAMSGGWSPAVHLHSQIKGGLRYDDSLAAFVPERPAEAVRSAGGCNGAFTLGGCLAQGAQAGKEAAAEAGYATARQSIALPRSRDTATGPIRVLAAIPSTRPIGQGAEHFVDFQNDVTAADLGLAAREGYASVEHAKRYTTTGMGTDQGKTSNINALHLLSHHLDVTPPSVGITTFRPPYTPVTFGALAGRDIGPLYQPIRRTPMQSWHETQGAVFEDVGQWRRPYYYPKAGEEKAGAVRREVLAVRKSVGILDASTLGKIDIKGPDAATFLDRIYTNDWSRLAVGRCRYGLMCGEDGMVFDDGVTARLGEQHFLMHTTSGNAERVFAWLEEWLQTEWPDLKVRCTSVTEHYANVTIAGPESRRLLSDLTTDLDLGDEAFPHMSVMEGTVAGFPARILRVSYTGERSYEINVAANCGMALWQAVLMAGAQYGVTPYGTEAMHVLRAEKGFILIGQETDGTVTPLDLGMDWAVSKRKDFLGKRSLSRADMQKPDRKQLVGLIAQDPADVPPEGAAIVEPVRPKTPAKAIGHVTSSYYSPTYDYAIALALVRGGRARHGETVGISLEDGRIVEAQISGPDFHNWFGGIRNG